MKTLKLSKVIEGFVLDQRARQLSEHTIQDYQQGYRKLQAYLGSDPLFHTITVEQIRAFFAYLNTAVASPNGVATRPAKTLSKKTILNIHTALSALWTWATQPEQGFAKTHVVRAIKRPKPEKRAIHPFTDEEINALLEHCLESQPYRHYRNPDGDKSRFQLPTGRRDRAILLLLVDTGIRASELCDLRIGDVDRQTNQIRVIGKGDKERYVPFSARTAKALWHYLSVDRANADESERLFLTIRATPMDRNTLLQLTKAIGERAGVADAHPHRFRHTFATMFLRNGGNTLTLQVLLGHESLDMVKIYAEIAAVDTVLHHRHASPVANLKPAKR